VDDTGNPADPVDMDESTGETGPVWWTLAEAAAEVGKSTKTIRRRVKQGRIVAQRDESDPRAPWNVRADSVLAMFAESDTSPAGKPPTRAMQSSEDWQELRRLWLEAQQEAKAEWKRAERAEMAVDRAEQDADRHRSDADRARREADELRARLAKVEAVLSKRQRRRLDG